MADNQFIIRKGLISLDDSQITGSLSVTNSVTASFFTGSYRGDGSQLTGIEGFPFTGSAGITGSLTVVGPVNATTFTGDGSQLTGIEGFPFTGSAKITGSLEVTGSVTATSFTGSLQGIATSASYVQLANIDGFTAYSASVNTAIDSVLDATTPLTATVNTTNSPFTVTSQSIVIIDSTNGDVTVNLPDLNTINGTPSQKPILLYKNDYSQNVVYVEPSGSQLVNGTTQDIIVSIQIAIAYNPTSAGWVTEGTSYQSLAELELFFVPRTETGSFATTGSNQFSGSQVITGSLTVTGNIIGNITGSASTASYVEYTNVANKPAIVSGSSQITYSGLTGIPSGILSGSAQIADFGIFATTGSNQFNGNQSITGSLTVSGQVVAQTLNVQQVTSSIVYSSGSNIFGNSLANTQQFTGSVGVTGSLTVAGTTTANGISSIGREQAFTWQRTTGTASDVYSLNADSGGAYLYNNTTSNMLMQWLEGGNVSIGGYTPLSVLDVIVGASGARRILFNYDDSTISIKGASNTSAPENLRLIGDSIIFNTGTTGSGTEKLRLNSTGNLGLGVTPSAWSVIQAMQVLNTSWGASPNNLILYQSSNVFYDGAFKYITTGTASQYRMNDSGIFSWLQAPSGTAGNAISFTQAMTLDASGRLGIGETSPNAPLHVKNSSNGFIQRFAGGTSSAITGGIFAEIGRDFASIGTISNHGFRLFTADNDRIVITNGGNVGMGTDSPTEKLQVDGSIRALQTNNTGIAQVIADASNTTNLRCGLATFGNSASDVLLGIARASNSFLYKNGAALAIGTGNAYSLVLSTSDIVRMTIDASGNIGAPTGTNIYNASDSRLKQNIQTISNGLDKISALNPVKFNWIDGFVPSEDGKDMLGFVAQEVYEVIPEAVENFGNNSIIVNDIEIENPLRVNEKFIIPVLVKAIQEQQSQIEILKAEIQTLKQ